MNTRRIRRVLPPALLVLGLVVGTVACNNSDYTIENRGDNTTIHNNETRTTAIFQFLQNIGIDKSYPNLDSTDISAGQAYYFEVFLFPSLNYGDAQYRWINLWKSPDWEARVRFMDGVLGAWQEGAKRMSFNFDRHTFTGVTNGY